MVHNISCDKVEHKKIKNFVKEKVQFRCGMMFDLKEIAGIEIHQNGIYIRINTKLPKVNIEGKIYSAVR